MEIRRLAIEGPAVIVPTQLSDERGFVSETFRQDWFFTNIARQQFVQDNHSHSRHGNTIRGIHFQIAPHAQGKLVRVVRGAVWDVAVDLRAGSPTYGRHVGVELSADNWHQLWIPIGFGHGFCTLEPDTEVVYKLTAHYDAASERGVAWDDPDLAVPWPIRAGQPLISERDRRNGRFAAMPAYFKYDAPLS